MTEDDARHAVAELVPRETFARLEQYATYVAEESSRQNLVAASTLSSFWQRHILDSVQLVHLDGQHGPWLDVGSGAGLPGMVVALLTGRPMLLVEPRTLRAEFLVRCVDLLGLADRVEILKSRVETVRSSPVDVISARAVTSIDRLFSITQHLAASNTRWILPRGRTAVAEVAEARSLWHGTFEMVPSRTDPDAAIVVATNVRRWTAR